MKDIYGNNASMYALSAENFSVFRGLFKLEADLASCKRVKLIMRDYGYADLIPFVDGLEKELAEKVK